MRRFNLTASLTDGWVHPTDTGNPNSLSDEEIQEYDKIIQELKDGGGMFGSLGFHQQAMMRLKKRQDNIPVKDESRCNGFSKRLGGALINSFKIAYSGKEREENSESTMMIMPGRRHSVQPGLSSIMYQSSQETKIVLQDIKLSDSEDEGDSVENNQSGSHHSSCLRRKSLIVVSEGSPPTERAKSNRRKLTRDSLGFDPFASRRAGSLICGFRKPSSRAGSLICGFRKSSTCSNRSSVVDEEENGLICGWASRRRSSFLSLASDSLDREQTVQGSLTRTHSISSLTCDWDHSDLIRARAA